MNPILFQYNPILLNNEIDCNLLLTMIQSYLDYTGNITCVSEMIQIFNHSCFMIKLKKNL